MLIASWAGHGVSGCPVVWAGRGIVLCWAKMSALWCVRRGDHSLARAVGRSFAQDYAG